MPVRIFKQEIHDDIIVIAEYARHKWKKFFLQLYGVTACLQLKKERQTALTENNFCCLNDRTGWLFLAALMRQHKYQHYI